MRLYVVPVQQAHYGSVLAPYKTITYLFAPDGTAQRYLNKETTRLERVAAAVDGDTVRYEIPKALLGLPEQGGFALDFKWADGVNADHTVEDLYLNGDTAPYGRLCFRYRSGQPERSAEKSEKDV